MFEKIANYLRTRKLIKELVILLVSYAVFILGTVGWYYFDNCEQAGSCAFLGICGLINFFVYLTIVNYKTIKSIFSRSNDNNSPSFKALLIQLTLLLLVFFSFFLWMWIFISFIRYWFQSRINAYSYLYMDPLLFALLLYKLIYSFCCQNHKMPFPALH
jgi:hypothetical protein